MNYYLTHCDKNFLKYAERLFETLSLFSENKIIFYTVDFKYHSKYKNVIPIEFNSNIHKKHLSTYSSNTSISDSYKAYNVFFKPFIIKNLLDNKIYSNDNFCYLDADCLAISNCDNIFKKINNIIDYPLFNKCCHDYMLMDGNGDPFVNNGFDLNLTLEAKLMNYLNINLNNRKQYLQTGVFLFNKLCSSFIEEWCLTCSLSDIVQNWKTFTPFHEETVANCLLWKKNNLIDLNQSLINLPYNTYDYDLSFNKIKQMIDCLNNCTENKFFIDTFCLIPAKKDLSDLHFYHGKISDSEYNYVKERMTKNYLLKINSQSLGDTIAATPTLRKLYKSYDKKIDVITYHPELFKNNKYVNNVFSFSDQINEKVYIEIFNTFLGIGGEKNKYGVEKKHNTIDIRQYHAIDLGFMLNENEMEYDYIPDQFIEIDNLPKKYICLHVANTWPSRTFSDENWQKLINDLNNNNISVVLVGKNGHETGFFNVDKPTKKLIVKKGIDLTNKLNISQCWHVINNSEYFITMDSGLLHLAGTTQTNIIQLGSSINYKLRAPYRNNSQSYKYKYIGGSCDIFCASDIKYGVREWKTIQGIPPLINCLENKNSFECHPKSIDVVNYIFENYKIEKPNNKKFLFITPHLSTGGSPKYLEWLINEKINEGFDVKLIEWNLYSSIFVVQRNCIIEMIGKDNFLNVGHFSQDNDFFEKQTPMVIDFIKDFNPDYIHLNEFSENFSIANLTNDMISFLYDKNRNFKLFETTHSAKTEINKKTYIPDELWLVSDYQFKIAKNCGLNSRVYEMNIQNKKRPDRNETLQSLGLNSNKLHVLQVGLFCKNKNQKFLFDLAKKFLDKNVEFHFIGNECYIDECEIDKNTKNCRIWGERDDVEKFMSCMDVFVLPSFEELNPISIKEALSWQMKCFISDIEILRHNYRENELLEFISDDNLENYINENLPKNLINNNFNIFEDSIEPNEIKCTFYPNPRIEILGQEDIVYNVKFIDEATNINHFQTNLRTNHWTACSISYFCKWKIIVTNIKYGIEKIFNLDLTNKCIKIINESGSLGDSISWIAAIDIFQKKHNCIVDYYTPRKNLFEKEYANINFYDYEQIIDRSYYAQYKIGCFDIDTQKTLTNKDWRLISLQQVAFSILGLDFSETKSKITIPNKYKCNFEKYVCIACQSTSQSRYWNNNKGWQNIVKYIKDKGYKVICVDKYLSYGSQDSMNSCPESIDYFAGNHSFEDIIDIINGCEFFIGLSSGLSWLAWALDKKIIKINGSVKESFEFYTPYCLQNTAVCNGCFNNEKYKFDPSNWKWCPEDKNFECTKNITHNQVIEKIDLILNDNSIKKNKIKLVHLQTTVNTENEKKSQAFIEQFKNFGIDYVNHKNELYDKNDYNLNCLYPDLLKVDSADKLTNRHYGCFDSYRKAILNEFNDNVDYLIICEGDCLFEISHTEFIAILNQITEICKQENISYFSFGDTKTLENKILQSEILYVPKDQNLCFITNKIIGIQCVMFDKNIKNLLIDDFKNQPWYIMDGWLNEFCWRHNLKMGITFNRITTQYSGESFIDKRIKNF